LDFCRLFVADCCPDWKNTLSDNKINLEGSTKKYRTGWILTVNQSDQTEYLVPHGASFASVDLISGSDGHLPPQKQYRFRFKEGSFQMKAH